MSDSYRQQCGVRQGGLSSPILFNVCINELIEALSSQHVGCHINELFVNNLSYADDMMLLSASICGLRRLVKLCEEYACHHGFIDNVAKSRALMPS